MNAGTHQLTDPFGRDITYLRLSVTDRCDFRCLYCMAEEMSFLPRRDILSLEELTLVGRAFIGLGIKKIRLTGGEPLIRKNVMQLVEGLGQHPALDELTLTTNGSQLTRYAPALRQAGVKRINISLDSLQAERFREITRTGELQQVIAGIDAACAESFSRLKINSVILKGRNQDEILDLVEFARDRQIDISFIEEMPLGLIDQHDRDIRFCSGQEVKATIAKRYPLSPVSDNTGGPSRYFRMSDSPIRVGFILPYSDNFCHLCNRVRLTVEGRLLLCLGNEHSVDLKPILRRHPNQIEPLQEAILQAITIKPERHHFDSAEQEQIVRFMNMTGG